MILRRNVLILLTVAGLGAGLGLCGIVGRLAPVAAAEASTPVASASSYAPIEAYLKAHCLECHNEKVQKGDLALHLYHDEASVLRDRKVFEDVLEKVHAGEMPPKKKPRPDKAESEAFLRNIEGIFERHDRNAPVDPGHVTVRRLNRTEYNNTIRDLVGVDSQPAEDFPSDDVGQGFDNIGDVLSLSPVLLERYLSAADAIMQRAIPLNPIPPLNHYVSGRYLEPAIRESDLPDKQQRPLSVNKELRTNYALPDEGEYTIRARVYPDVTEDEGQPAVVALTVDRKPVKTFEVLQGDRKTPALLEAKVNLPSGPHRFGVKVLSGWENNPNWILRVQGIGLVGPPDTRPASQRMLLGCDEKLSHHEQTQQVLKRFATRAYRRPATSDEVDALVGFAERAETAGEKWENAVSLAMQAVLVSPKFLFRVELDDRPDSAGPHPLDEYQLASRLSYFLWSTMPDDELFDLASKKQLFNNLEPQVRRMLADPKSQALVDNFAMQWLQLRRLKGFTPDSSMFPRFNEELRRSMLTETSLFFQAIMREDRSILELIDSDFTFLNEPLANYYGIGDTNGNPAWVKPVTEKGDSIRGNEFVRVHLVNRDRGGVITQASVLTVTSNPTRTSPVKRGKFVLEQILGVPPPPPPANVPDLPADAKAVASGSLRQRMEQHRADPNCANCHEHMDGIGFALENFDAVGGYRWNDGPFKLDPSGTMPDGSSFKGAGELKAILKGKKDLFSRCLTKKMLTYAMGRGVEYYDGRAVEKIVSALNQHDYKFSTLVVEIAKSSPFSQRRGKEQNP